MCQLRWSNVPELETVRTQPVRDCAHIRLQHRCEDDRGGTHDVGIIARPAATWAPRPYFLSRVRLFERRRVVMSAISRAVEVPRHRAEKKQAELSEVSRWGAPIWAAEEPDPRLER